MGRHGTANKSSGMEGCEETLKPTKAQLVIYTGEKRTRREHSVHEVDDETSFPEAEFGGENRRMKRQRTNRILSTWLEMRFACSDGEEDGTLDDLTSAISFDDK